MEYLFLNTPDAVAEAVRSRRASHRLTQTQLAERANVGRRFISDLEAGHPRAELAKVLAVLEALDIHATAIPSTPSGQRRGEVDLAAVVERFA